MPPNRPTTPETAQPSRTASAYIALGSNLGGRAKNLDRAVAALAALPRVSKVVPSSYHETDPVGPQDQDKFLNAAARVETNLSPMQLLEQMLALELELGRAPREERQHWGPREIDLDLLLHGDTVLELPGLTLPHPRLHERTFVLAPLCEIAAEVVHPTLGKTMGELLDALHPQTEVAR